ncbi:finger BED domain-containing 1-like [Octopus vulgaris]|uniref:Finger BED domain-containing 1-like n=1 Tax=Octopus vulgaris TaxID=6645 RepID=A0AA36F0W0_OCTVU|nr:finger BED domain-containing 1-like [Octopus vulgaris]
MSGEEKQYKGLKLFGSDWGNISKYINVLDLFCQATVLFGGEKFVSYSCVIPLLLSLTKHMTVNDDDPSCIGRFKATSVNGFSKRVAGMKSIEILQTATALGPRYKYLKCLSDDSKEQTWLLIGQQIVVDVNDDRLKTNAQDDTDSVNKTICEVNEKRMKLMESDSDLEEDVENASDEVQRYKMEKKVVKSVDPLQWWKLNEHRYLK